jgi:hypothetical protein
VRRTQVPRENQKRTPQIRGKRERGRERERERPRKLRRWPTALTNPETETSVHFAKQTTTKVSK